MWHKSRYASDGAEPLGSAARFFLAPTGSAGLAWVWRQIADPRVEPRLPTVMPHEAPAMALRMKAHAALGPMALLAILGASARQASAGPTKPTPPTPPPAPAPPPAASLRSAIGRVI